MSQHKRKAEALFGENADAEPKVIMPETVSPSSSVVVANTSTCRAGKEDNASDTLSSYPILPPGIFGKIGTFIGLTHAGDLQPKNDTMTLFSFCLAVGPQVASCIREAYLGNRLYYLEYLESYRRVFHRISLSDEECAVFGQKLKQWMVHNPWWQEACLSPTTFHQKTNGFLHPPICKVIRMNRFDDLDCDSRNFLLTSIYSTTSLQVAINPRNCWTLSLFDWGWDDRDDDYIVALSVNGNKDSVSSTEKLKEILAAPGPEKEVSVMHKTFAEFFFNPVLSINLGLFDLLRFQLEELKLDVNEQNWIGPRIGDVNLPPIFHSMVQPDEIIFKYLLSFDGIDLNPRLHYHPISGRAMEETSGTFFLHHLSQVVGAILQGKFEMSRLKSLLSQKRVDVNSGPLFPAGAGGDAPERLPPLYCIACSAIKFDSDFDIVEAYVESGAVIEYTLNIASSPGFASGLHRGVAMTLETFRPRFSASLENDVPVVTFEDMSAKHQRLVALLRKLKDEKDKM